MVEQPPKLLRKPHVTEGFSQYTDKKMYKEKMYVQGLSIYKKIFVYKNKIFVTYSLTKIF
jgi:hypothetical protein